MESHYGDIRWKVGQFYLSFPEVLTFVIAFALAGAAWALLRYTDLGKGMRAAAEDAPVAAAFGVNHKQLALLLSGACAAYAAPRDAGDTDREED